MDLIHKVNSKLDLIDQIINDETKVSSPDYYQVGIDLGTADIQTIVVDQNGEPIAAFLDWSNVVKDGVVVDYFGACQIVQKQIKQVENKLGIKVQSAVTSYPPGTDPKISTNVIESADINVSAVIDEPSSVALLLKIDNGAVVDIGGGTTGTAVINQSTLVHSVDDATGGHHASLTLSGALKLDLEEAELLKRSAKDQKKVATIVKPVIENMASIVERHISSLDHIPVIYLTGGGSLILGFCDIFQNHFPDKKIVHFPKALYLTPLAIASYQLEKIT